MTVYADILLAVNCVMNSFILWCAAKITQQRIKPLSVFAGGLSMALLHGIFLFIPGVAVHPLIASVFILSAGVGVSLRPSRPRQFFILLFTAYAASFALGGLGMGLFYLTDLPYALSILSAGTNDFNMPWYLPAACVPAAYAAVKICARLLERRAIKRQLVCPVQVFIGESEICFNALIDTGHSLREPISQSPVIIAEFEQVKKFLPEAIQVLFFEQKENSLSSILQREQSAFDARLRMIPFNSVGRANGMLLGFKPDKVRVGGETPVQNAVIGVYNRRLTCDGRYQGLLSPELLAVKN